MTLASALKTVSQSNNIIFKGGNGRTQLVRANGSDLFLTAIVTAYGETLPDVDLAASGEPVGGVIISEMLPYSVNLDKDSDDTFDDDTYLGMYIPEDGDELYLTVKTNSSIAQSNWFKADGGFIVTSTKAAGLGTVLTAITAASATEQIVLCRWGVDA